jgi:hypothetical protein
MASVTAASKREGALFPLPADGTKPGLASVGAASSHDTGVGGGVPTSTAIATVHGT